MTNLFLLGIIAVGIWFIASTLTDLQQKKRTMGITDFNQKIDASNDCVGFKDGKLVVIPCDKVFGRDD